MNERKTKPCCVAGCNAVIRSEYLMCARHWKKVPLRIQHEACRTFDEWKRGGSVRAYLLATVRAQIAVAEAEKKTRMIEVLEKEIAAIEARIAKKPEVVA